MRALLARAGDGDAVVTIRPGTRLLMGLDPNPDTDREEFSPRRTGLDRFELQLAGREDIDQWVSSLDAIGRRPEAGFEGAEPSCTLSLGDTAGGPTEAFI